MIKLLSKRIFWDTDIQTLDYLKNRDFIIGRIVMYGTEEDEKLLYKIYSWRVVRKVVIKEEYLSEKIVRYLSYMLNVKEQKFKCFGKIPSHVNY